MDRPHIKKALILGRHERVRHVLEGYLGKACNAKMVHHAENNEGALEAIDIHGKKIEVVIIGVDEHSSCLVGLVEKLHPDTLVILTGPSTVEKPQVRESHHFVRHHDVKDGALSRIIRGVYAQRTEDKSKTGGGKHGHNSHSR